MKILALYHTAWIETMLKCWQRFGKAEIAALPLPVADWNQTPGLKDKIARLIIDYAMVWRPDMILDINGVGVLPVAGQSRWTPELAMIPWIEWWFEDPFASALRVQEEGAIEPWLKSLGCPLVRSFIWDAALAREYSEWTGKRWICLPAATDPDVFSPAAAEASDVKPEPRSVCFFGTFMPKPDADDSELGSEIAKVAASRIASPGKNYFETLKASPNAFPKLTAAFGRAQRHRWGSLDREILDIKKKCCEKVAWALRGEALTSIAKATRSCAFVGDGYPKELGASSEKLYVPAALSAFYESATVSLDLPNGQSFSGSNMRVYEIMASGGVLACRSKPDFDPTGRLDGKAYFSFESPEELPMLCESLKNAPAQRTAVQTEARRLVRRAHTWNHRLLALMDAVSKPL